MNGKITCDPATMNGAIANIAECQDALRKVSEYASQHCSLDGAFGLLLQPLQPIHNGARDKVMDNLNTLADTLAQTSESVGKALEQCEQLEDEISRCCDNYTQQLDAGCSSPGGGGGGGGGGASSGAPQPAPEAPALPGPATIPGPGTDGQPAGGNASPGEDEPDGNDETCDAENPGAGTPGEEGITDDHATHGGEDAGGGDGIDSGADPGAGLPQWVIDCAFPPGHQPTAAEIEALREQWSNRDPLKIEIRLDVNATIGFGDSAAQQLRPINVALDLDAVIAAGRSDGALGFDGARDRTMLHSHTGRVLQ